MDIRGQLGRCRLQAQFLAQADDHVYQQRMAVETHVAAARQILKNHRGCGAVVPIDYELFQSETDRKTGDPSDCPVDGQLRLFFSLCVGPSPLVGRSRLTLVEHGRSRYAA